MPKISNPDAKPERYICLKCGNVYKSRAKVPQCPVCKSKKRVKVAELAKMPESARKIYLERRGLKYEDYAKLFEVERDEAKEENPEELAKELHEEVEEHKEEEAKTVVNPVDGKEYRLKTPEEMGKKKVTNPVTGSEYEVRERKKPAKAKGLWGLIEDAKEIAEEDEEEAEKKSKKRGIGMPRIPVKVYVIAAILGTIFVLYKAGFFDSIIEYIGGLIGGDKDEGN